MQGSVRADSFVTQGQTREAAGQLGPNLSKDTDTKLSTVPYHTITVAKEESFVEQPSIDPLF